MFWFTAAAVLWGTSAGLLIPRAACRLSVPPDEPWRAVCPTGRTSQGAGRRAPGLGEGAGLRGLEADPRTAVVGDVEHGLTIQCRRVRQLAAPGFDLRERSRQARAPPWVQHYPAHVDGDQGPPPVPLRITRPPRQQRRVGHRGGEHRFRQRPRHSPCLPPSPPVGRSSACTHPTTGPTTAGQRTTTPRRGLCAELLAHVHAAQPDTWLPGSRVVRSDVAAATAGKGSHRTRRCHWYGRYGRKI